MPEVMCLHLDDSGTRNPDRKLPRELLYRDWFALGGYVSREKDEGVIRTAHADFCEAWDINYPLHSYDIRAETEKFTWLAGLDQRQKNRFMSGLTRLLTSIPVVGHACVVDRPGYNARYREQYGRQTWMLCKTAFSVVCERAAKHALRNGCKLRVYVEEGDKTSDDMIREYYRDLRTSGMPFASETSLQYAPLSREELASVLYELDFKAKTSPMIQIADLYAYPIARGRYDPDYFPYAHLQANKKLIDNILNEKDVPHLGIKYSCFELIDANKKSRR
jgi:hypothetical protein